MEKSDLLYVVGVYEGDKHFTYNNCKSEEENFIMVNAFASQFAALLEDGANSTPMIIIAAIITLMDESPKFKEMLIGAKVHRMNMDEKVKSTDIN